MDIAETNVPGSGEEVAVESLPLIEKALATSHLYGLLSSAFLYPDEATLSNLRGAWQEAESAIAILGCPDGLLEAMESLRSRLEQVSPLDLQSEYTGIFSHTISEECPAYETQYGQSHIFQQTQALADIAGFYKAFGLEISDECRERFDNIAVELEFMAFMAHKEAYALTSGEEEQASVCQDAERKFLSNHLGRWVGQFAMRLNEKTSDGFYPDLVEGTRAFVDFDLETKGAKASEYGGLTPVASEGEGDCFTCGGEDVCFPTEG